MGCEPAMSPRTAVMAAAWSAVSSTPGPTRAARASTSAARIARSRSSGVVHAHRRRHDALPAAGDHADLEGQELVEGKASEGGSAARRIVGEVGLLQRSGDPHQPLRPQERGREVLPVRRQAVERGPDRGAQRLQGQPRRERVDRHDPADVQQLVVGRLEGGALEDHREAALLELAREDVLGPGDQPTLHELAAVPLRLRRAGRVVKRNRRDLGPAARGPAEPHGADTGTRAHDITVAEPLRAHAACGPRAGRRSVAATRRAGREPFGGRSAHRPGPEPPRRAGGSSGAGSRRHPPAAALHALGAPPRKPRPLPYSTLTRYR